MMQALYAHMNNKKIKNKKKNEIPGMRSSLSTNLKKDLRTIYSKEQ
jgi:hypothetical protein